MIPTAPPALSAPALVASVEGAPAIPVSRLSAADLFGLADHARAAGQFDKAAALYEALFNDANGDVRAEARFRLAMMRADQGRFTEAATGLRRLLDERPEAVRVRLELARILAAMGDEVAARRALRQARAGGLPEDVAITVQQFDLALRSRQPFGGSFELSVAPDSNVNRATSARVLDTAIAPLTLSEDARALSGVGLRIGGQAFVRQQVSERVALIPRLAALSTLYRDKRFNDASGNASVAIEWRTGRDRVTPGLTYGRRWYGGRPYASTASAAIDWIHPLGKRAQLVLHSAAGRVRYRVNDLQNGSLFDAALGVEAAATPTSGWSLTVSGYRQAARDKGYAVTSGGVNTLAWRDLGRFTVTATTGLSRLKGDERLFLFADKRREWLLRAGAAVTARALTVAGFAPVFRLNLERNWSTVGLYAYRRVASDVGIVRAF